jgi:predicted Fe-Mo cluster-binding NifX family protein
VKVAVTSTGNKIESPVDPRFGRCVNFLIVETDSMSFEIVPNAAVGSAHGAGIMAAQLIASKGVKVVLTGQVGPNAYNALTASKVKIITGVSGTVLDAVEKFKRGELKQTERPTVSGHFGLGGRGMGRGMGRGRRQ